MSKKNRIQEAFNYLKYKGLTTSQKDLSEKMGANRVSVSRALNGDESYLTDDFIERFNTTFGSVFSVCWLLTGEGGMLKSEVASPITTPTEESEISNLSKALDEIAAQRRMTEKALEQIERLITLLTEK